MAVRIGRALFLGFFAILLQRYYTLLGFHHDDMIDKHFEVSLKFIKREKKNKSSTAKNDANFNFKVHFRSSTYESDDLNKNRKSVSFQGYDCSNILEGTGSEDIATTEDGLAFITTGLSIRFSK